MIGGTTRVGIPKGVMPGPGKVGDGPGTGIRTNRVIFGSEAGFF